MTSAGKGTTLRHDRPGVVMLMRGFYPISGGYENQSLRLAEEMRRRNVDVRVLTQRHATLSEYEVHRDVPIHRVRAFRKGHLAAITFLLTTFAWMLRHRRMIRVIHANRSTSGLVAGVVGRLLGRPVLCKLTGGAEISEKGLGDTWLGWLKLQCLKRTVDRFVAITAAIEHDLRQLGIPSKQIVRIPNGLDRRSPWHDPEATRSALGIDASAPVVTCVGRLIAEKGIDWLLEAWQEVVREKPAARLLLVGDGPHRAALEAKASAVGAEGSVVFLGQRKDVERILAITQVFVLPSRREGMSNALLEAMGEGLPVVVSDDLAGGNREVVTDGEHGFVVPLGDRLRLARAVLRLLSDADLRRDFGERARRAVVERFSIEIVAERYCALYDELSPATESSRKEALTS